MHETETVAGGWNPRLRDAFAWVYVWVRQPAALLFDVLNKTSSSRSSPTPRGE